MKLLSLLLSLCTFLTAQANILVIEYKGEEATFEHAQHVEHIACENLDKSQCSSLYTVVYLDQFVEEFYAKIGAKKVVNMSFGFYRPMSMKFPGGKESYLSREKIDQGIEDFHKQNSNFKQLFADNKDKIFVIAAGNGHPDFGPKAVPLGKMYPAYPNIFNTENTLKVAAIDDDKPEELADYSNYSLWTVDVAAIVERGVNNKLIKGTSFATPSVSKMIGKISRRYPHLSGSQLKEIIMKSVYIHNIEDTIRITENHMMLGEESLAHKIHHTFHYGDREKLRAQKGEVLLVRSGGIANFKTAMMCADLFHSISKDLSITEACLKAQRLNYKRTQEELNKLRDLWTLRNLNTTGDSI